MKVLLAILLAAPVLVDLAHAQPTNPAPIPEYGTLGATAFRSLHGVNLGNFLEAPSEGAWSGGRLIEEGDFSIIRQAGFSLVRVPIRWAAHLTGISDLHAGGENVPSNVTCTIDPDFFARVDWVVAQAQKNGLVAILDYHNDDELMKQPDANADLFISIWKQIAEHYKNAPATVFFELLNEPHGNLDAPHWNSLLAQALVAVRASNPTRTVVVGPIGWNGIWALDKLVLPDDERNLLVTVHFYDPFHFTHQGAEWAEGSSAWLGTKWGSDADQAAITKSFDQAAKWGADHHRPIYLGEFGAYSKSPIEGRAQWTAFVARTAEAHGMPWTYWEFCSGFGVYDPEAKAWRQPLLDALLPK